MTAKVERLVNLTVALLEARRPLTFHEIRSRTGYYGQDDPESARRMFERDKDDLRRLGVPVETRSLDAFDVELGYTIDRHDYELPDIDLDAQEVAALALALQVAGDRASRLALSKVAARAPDPDEIRSLPARVDVGAEAVDDVADALVERRVVRFRYRTAEGALGERTVDPYAVVHRRGAWYLVARDHDRDALRAFRLDRVDGRIRPVGEPGAFVPPADLDPAAVAGPGGEVDAEVAVAPTVTWEAETRGGTPTGRELDGWPVYRFSSGNPWRLASWALGLGPDVEVIAPPELRAEVERRLAAAAGGRG